MNDASTDSLSVPENAATDGPMRVALTFDDALADQALAAAPLVEAHGWRALFCITTDYVGHDDAHMTWAQAKDLVARGHELASHAKTHPNMPKLVAEGRADAARAELALSRDAIADRTGFAPRFYVSPYVLQNGETDRLSREAGLRQALPCRRNFGEGDEGRTREILEAEIAKGTKRLDILTHGIFAGGRGGWKPFATLDDFKRHLDDVAALEKEGKIVVTDYDGMASDCRLRAPAWPHHGVVALSFDDSRFGDWARALPLFARHAARATFFACGDIDGAAVAFARKALEAGHEFGLHGLRHRDAARGLEGADAGAFWAEEIEPQLAACRAAGIPIRSYAYPNCLRSDGADAAFAAHGFTRLRGTPNGVRPPNPYDPNGERRALWRPVATADEQYAPAAAFLSRTLVGNVVLGEAYRTDIEDVLAAVRRCGARGEFLSLVSHGIAPDARGIDMKTEWLERLLSSAAEAGVLVRGVR